MRSMLFWCERGDWEESKALVSHRLGVVSNAYGVGLAPSPARDQWVRDVIFDEYCSQVRCDNISQVMAALSNTVIGLTHWAGRTNITAACRGFAAQPVFTLELLGSALENSMTMGL